MTGLGAALMDEFVLHPDAKDLLAAWYEARGDGALPSKGFIDPIRLRRWIGDISVVHLKEGEKRFYIALHGDKVARHLGPDFNKKYLEDVIPDSAKDDAFAPYDLSIETKLPCYSIQRRTFDNRLVDTLERMVMPCTNEDPARTTRFLIWVAPIRPSIVNDTSVYTSPDEEPAEYARGEPADRTAVLFTLPEPSGR